MTSPSDYMDIKFEIKNRIGIIKFNRPKSLNSFGGGLIQDVIAALRVLNEHPETIFTVLTGEGRFFSAGADVKGIASNGETFKNDGEKKLKYLERFSYGMHSNSAHRSLKWCLVKRTISNNSLQLVSF
jgi:peroxisomal 3,2-trans-enoyl-CoA isomerase